MIRSTVNAHRYLWLSIGWIMGLFCLLQGAGYAYAGNNQVHSPSLYVLSRIPGHMHTHGVIMVGLAVIFFYSLRGSDKFTKKVLEIFCGYCVVVSVSIFGSWAITNDVVFGAPWFWIAFAGISGSMIIFPAPPLMDERHDAA